MQRRSQSHSAFFKRNPDFGKINPNTVYPQFFENGQPLYAKIKEGILNPDKPDSRAIDCFRVIFQPSVKMGTKSLTDATYFKKIRKEFGNQIVCTGVEEQKGGLTSLLLMCLTGYVRLTTASWGTLGDYGSMPNTDPGAHGPYFVVYSVDATAGKEKLSTNPRIKKMDYILVPFIENVNWIKEQVDKLLQYGMITSDEATRFKDKLVDYQGFYEQLVRFKENPIALQKFQETTKSNTPTKPLKRSRLSKDFKGGVKLDFGGPEDPPATVLAATQLRVLKDDESDNQKPVKRMAPMAPTIDDILAPPKPTP